MPCKSSCDNVPSTCTNLCPGTSPAGPNHQKEVIDAIKYILDMPSPAFEAFAMGNGFNKVVRNYQYWWTSKGCDPYGKLQIGKACFRRTEAANAAITSPQFLDATEWSKSGVHPEHSVPVSMVIQELKRLRGLHLKARTPFLCPQIEKVVRTTEIVLVTRDEQKRLDGSKGKNFIDTNNKNQTCLGLGQKMPDVNGKEWTFNDCHLARICEVTGQIFGRRML